MKINFIVPHTKIAGGVRIALNYAHFLGLKGHKVNIIVINPIGWRRFLANILNVKLKWFKNIQAKILRVPALEEKYIPDADISVACDYTKAEVVNVLSDKKGKKFELVMHDERLYHGPKEDVQKSYEYPLQKIVISNWLKDIIKNDFHQDSDLLLTPVDFDLFHKEDTQKKDNEVRILLLHHTYAWKGVKEGIEAIKNVKNKFPNVKLVMFGVRAENPEEECDEYHYNLPQEKLSWLYSSCDIFLCPSWYEGLGMPAMEAMACGSCVVTFDTGGSRDYAFDGRTAFVAEHRNLDQLIEKLSLAIKNKKLREEIAQNGYNFIHNDIENWEESTNRLESIFLDSLK